MIARPISLRDPQLTRLVAGQLTILRRPLSRHTERLGPGDMLWVREPFALAKRYDGLSPSAAAGLGAQPIFMVVAGQPQADLFAAGRQRFARELLRQWHRFHLVIARVDRQPLQAVTQAELSAEGFHTRSSFIAAWDRNLSLSRQGTNTWDENPLVAVLHFTAVAAPLPETAG